MRKIKEVLRMKYELNLGQRQIAQSSHAPVRLPARRAFQRLYDDFLYLVITVSAARPASARHTIFQTVLKKSGAPFPRHAK